MPAKILVIANGARGDAQPFIGICSTLIKAGFDAEIFTNPDHEKLAKNANITYHDNGIPILEVLQSEVANKAFQSNNFLTFLDAIGAQNGKYGPTMIQKLYALLSTDAKKPDLVVCGTQHWVDGAWIYDLFKIPYVICTLSNNMTPNTHAAPFGLPSTCGCMNYMLWNVVNSVWMKGAKKGYGYELGKLVGKTTDEFFPDAADCRSVFRSDDVFNSVPYMIGQSELIVGRQPWDSASVVYTGPLKMNLDAMKGEEFGSTQNNALERFLAAGTTPVYMGWGSVLVGTAASMTAFAVRTLKAANQRGIVLGGWAAIKMEELKNEKDAAELLEYSEKNILFMETAKHETLFPRCSVIVHHGGSGTSAAGFSSGRPNIVTPILYDQFDFAKRFEELGMGLNAGALVKTTPEKLAERIQTCLTDEKIKAKAKEIADGLAKESGNDKVTCIITKFLNEDVKTGKFHEAMQLALAKRTERKSASCFGWLAAWISKVTWYQEVMTCKLVASAE